MKYQHHVTGLEVSSYFDDFIFLQIVAVQNQVEGEAGL